MKIRACTSCKIFITKELSIKIFIPNDLSPNLSDFAQCCGQNLPNKGVMNLDSEAKTNTEISGFARMKNDSAYSVVKELSPGFPGLSSVYFHFTKWAKTNGHVFGWL